MRFCRRPPIYPLLVRMLVRACARPCVGLCRPIRTLVAVAIGNDVAIALSIGVHRGTASIKPRCLCEPLCRALRGGLVQPCCPHKPRTRRPARDIHCAGLCTRNHFSRHTLVRGLCSFVYDSFFSIRFSNQYFSITGHLCSNKHPRLYY